MVKELSNIVVVVAGAVVDVEQSMTAKRMPVTHAKAVANVVVVVVVVVSLC